MISGRLRWLGVLYHPIKRKWNYALRNKVMAETPPILFRRHLGGLYPANTYAEKQLEALDRSAPVRVEFKKTRGNDRRMALYWVVLAKAAEALSDMCEGDALDAVLLHRVLKKRRGLFTTTRLPSGEVIENLDSISFAKMPENERAAYVDWAFNTLAKWLGIPVQSLTSD